MSNIVERCETLLNDKKMSTVNFRKSDYVWEIGANILNELVRAFGQYDSVEFMVNEKSQSTTGWLLGIEYVIHPRNDIFRLVHKVSSYTYRDSDKVDAMRYMSTVNSYHSSNFIPAIKNNFNNWKLKLKCDIKNVIFNDPATIVFWDDGTKTVVKAENESFDPEKGLAMAIAKKSLGNQGNYYNEFKKWIPEEKAKWKDPVKKVCSSCKYFGLGPSSINTCLECLKGKNLPHWEKRDIWPVDNVSSLYEKQPEFLSVKVFAKKAGVSESTIRKQINKGQIYGAKKVNGKWMIPVGDAND